MIGSRVGIYGSGSAFIGILDTYPSLVGWALRLLKNNYSGGLIYAHAYDGSSHGKADIMPYRSGANYILDLNSTLENLDATALGRGLTTSDTLADLLDVGGSNYNGLTQKIYDQAGSSYDYEQGTTAAQPLFATAGALDTKGGKPCITISKTQYLSIPSSTATFKFLHDGTACSYVAVNSFGTGSNPNDVYALFGNNTNSLGDIGYYMRFDDRSAFSRNNRLADYIPNSSGVASCNTEVDNSITPNQNNIMFANIDADNGTAANRAMYYVNNGSVIQNNTQTGTASTANASHDLYLGRLPTGGFPMVGTFAEKILWNADKSGDRSGIQTNVNDFYSAY